MTTTSGHSAHLSLRGLRKTYSAANGAAKTVFDGLDLDVPRGQFVCILGASGSGKTTLIRALAGLENLDGGSVRIAGQTFATNRTQDRDCAFVFQHDALLPWRTVLDNVAFGLEMQGIGRKARSALARELLASVGLDAVAQHYPAALSGGMRQRVNLARALAVDRSVLLMDEPFSALDAQTREVMQRELLTIWARSGRTVIFITHQIDEAIYLADRIVVLGRHGAGIRADMQVNEPRPRPLSVKRSPAFLELADRLWNLLEADVEAASHQQG